MSAHKVDRRTVLKAAAALVASGFAPGLLFAKSGAAVKTLSGYRTI